MLERLIIALAIVVVGILVYRFFISRQGRQASSALLSLAGREAGKYLIVYFTSPSCVACQTAQRPALDTIHERYGERVQIITIDVTEQPNTAERWGVMSLPSTFIFNPKDVLIAHNIGVAHPRKLAQQLPDLALI